MEHARDADIMRVLCGAGGLEGGIDAGQARVEEAVLVFGAPAGIAVVVDLNFLNFSSRLAVDKLRRFDGFGIHNRTLLSLSRFRFSVSPDACVVDVSIRRRRRA